MRFFTETGSRLIAKVVRDLLRLETFESLADLTEALKRRCARLRIRWTNDGISDAFRVIASNTALVESPATVARHDERPDASRALSHDECVAILTHLEVRPSVRLMPRVRELSPVEIRRRQFVADQRKAMAIVEQEMLDSLRRCAALEARPQRGVMSVVDGSTPLGSARGDPVAQRR